VVLVEALCRTGGCATACFPVLPTAFIPSSGVCTSPTPPLVGVPRWGRGPSIRDPIERGAPPHGRHRISDCRPQVPLRHRRLVVPRWPACFRRGAGRLQWCWKHCCWRHRNPQVPDCGINDACSMTYVLKPVKSKDDGIRLGYRGIVPVRAGVTVPAARAAKGRRSDPDGVGGWSVSPATVKRYTRVHVWSVAHAVGSVGACARACPRKRFDACVCMVVAEREGIQIGFGAAFRPARARPLSSS